MKKNILIVVILYIFTIIIIPELVALIPTTESILTSVIKSEVSYIVKVVFLEIGALLVFFKLINHNDE